MKTDKSDETGLVGNSEFLSEVFGGDSAYACPVVVSFDGDPLTAPKEVWACRPWRGDSQDACGLPGTANNYFGLASFRPDEAGKYRRRKAYFHALHAVVLDDVGTKVDRERVTLPPTWLIETSPQNHQAGYVLSEPLTEGSLADRLVEAIIAAGLLRPGHDGPRTRLARLPVGVNGKSAPPFPCRMVGWSPGLRYSVDELVDGLQLDMAQARRPRRKGGRAAPGRPSDGDSVWIPRPEQNSVLVALQDRGLYKAPLGEGRHDITCPWVNEHTDEVDNGTAYFEPEDNWPVGGFKCLHGHCAHRHMRDLLRFLDVEINAARMKPTIYVFGGEIHRIVDAAERELAISRQHYQRGGLIVVVVTDPGRARPGAGHQSTGVSASPSWRRHLAAIRRPFGGIGAHRSSRSPCGGAI